MGTFQAIEISASGLDLQRLRLEVVAKNLANMNTVQVDNGMTYQPMMVVSRATGRHTASRFGSMVDTSVDGGVAGVVMTDTSAKPKLAYEPGHPNADSHGMVRYPGVDHAQQMVTMTDALRAYEANLAALHAARSMAAKALEIGGNQ